MKISNFKFKINPLNLLILALISYYLFFTLFNLNWGAPFYFHPDERNIASSISQLNLLSDLNPNFYAYGQLPIYTVYFLGILFKFFQTATFSPTVSFEHAIIIGRIISAALSIGLIFLIYKTTVELKNTSAGILALIFSTTSVAFIQFNHFGTFEMWLSFFYLLSSVMYFKFLSTQRYLYFILASIIFGLLCGLKLSSLVFGIVPLFALITHTLKIKTIKLKVIETLKLIIILLVASVATYILTSPFNLLDQKSFTNSMNYEGAVALGTLKVFYTGTFEDQIPIFYQLLKVFPFLINPVLTIISIPCIIYLFYISFKNKNYYLGLFLISLLALLIPTSFLYVKWTRYFVPVVAYLYILIAITIVDVVHNRKHLFSTMFLISVIGIVFSFSFIRTARLDQDTRLSALNFANKIIPHNSPVLSEVYDLGIVPFNSKFQNIELFNFYDLDNVITQKQMLAQVLNNAHYIILPSQRIFESRSSHRKSFPNGNKFYSELFTNKLNFKKIYETPCDIFCKIAYLGDPVFNVEQTSNVFDRPTVFIFKRTNVSESN